MWETIRHLAAWLIMLGTPAAHLLHRGQSRCRRRIGGGILTLPRLGRSTRRSNEPKLQGACATCAETAGRMISAPFISMSAALFAATTSPAPGMTPGPNMRFTTMGQED